MLFLSRLSAFNLLLIRDLRSYQISKLSRFLPQIVIASLFLAQLQHLNFARHNNPQQVCVCVCMSRSGTGSWQYLSYVLRLYHCLRTGTGIVYCNHRGTHCTSILILDLLKIHSTHHPRTNDRDRTTSLIPDLRCSNAPSHGLNRHRGDQETGPGPRRNTPRMNFQCQGLRNL